MIIAKIIVGIIIACFSFGIFSFSIFRKLKEKVCFFIFILQVYFNDLFFVFPRKFYQLLKLSYIQNLIFKTEGGLYQDYLQMKYEHYLKQYQILNKWNLKYIATNSKDSCNKYVKNYENFLKEISVKEKKLKKIYEDEKEYKDLLFSLKEIHWLAYKELEMIEYKLRSGLQEAFNELQQVAYEIDCFFKKQQQKQKEQLEKYSPLLKENFGESGIRIYKLLLNNEGELMVKLWLKSGMDFFKYWRVVDFIEKNILEFKEKISSTEFVPKIKINITVKDMFMVFASEMFFLTFAYLMVLPGLENISENKMINKSFSIEVIFICLILGITIPVWIKDKEKARMKKLKR